MNNTWGLLGPEFLPNTRRTRNLGLGASVRSFNDLAVPGLGGVWYGKQLLLATLGVAVAETARSRGTKVQNIEAANAIEALACWLAFKSNDWGTDARLRGSTKLQGKDDFSFRYVRQRNFYVTQPMRMATVQALPALGFVESDGSRFNAFHCSTAGKDFIEQATAGYRPRNRTIIEHLTLWVQMKENNVDTDALRQVLSPLEPLPNELIPLLRERLIQGGNELPEDKKRRTNALTWVESLRRDKPDRLMWTQQPVMISEEHWHDLQSGALFFEVRDATITALDTLEAHIGGRSNGQPYSLKEPIPDALKAPIEKLKSAAREYLDAKHVNEDAKKFCNECIADNSSRILRSLVGRDGHVLRLLGDEIKPGPAFRGVAPQATADDQDQETPHARNIPLPANISNRMRNLYRLNLDMLGELDSWLNLEADRSKE